MKATLLLWMVLFPFVIGPASAVVAGGITWAVTRGERPQDEDLLRHFLVILAMVLMASYAALSTDTVKERLDPSIRQRRELHAMPLQLAMKEHFPSAWPELEKEIEPLLAAGMPARRVQAALWPKYVARVRQLLPFSAPPAPRGYAEGLVPAMQELKDRDPAACVRLAWAAAPGGPVDPSAVLSAEALAGYQAGLLGVMQRNTQSVSPKAQAARNWNTHKLEELQAAYRAIEEAMAPRYGDATAKLRTPAVAQLDPVMACAASIELLQRAQRLPPGLSDWLLIGLLRS